jgi:hypothetical protein
MTIMIQFFCPMMIWLILVFFFTAIGLAVQEGWMRITRLHQIPCSRCTFSTGDYRLKCTVHPCQAFSEEAINCPDWKKVDCSQISSFINFINYLDSHSGDKVR